MPARPGLTSGLPGVEGGAFPASAMKVTRSGASFSASSAIDRPTFSAISGFGPAPLVSAAGHVIVQGIRPPGRLSVRHVANDRLDLLYNVTAGAAGSTPQQILDRSADLSFGIVPVDKVPIELI